MRLLVITLVTTTVSFQEISGHQESKSSSCNEKLPSPWYNHLASSYLVKSQALKSAPAKDITSSSFAKSYVCNSNVPHYQSSLPTDQDLETPGSITNIVLWSPGKIRQAGPATVIKTSNPEAVTPPKGLHEHSEPSIEDSNTSHIMTIPKKSSTGDTSTGMYSNPLLSQKSETNYAYCDSDSSSTANSNNFIEEPSPSSQFTSLSYATNPLNPASDTSESVPILPTLKESSISPTTNSLSSSASIHQTNSLSHIPSSNVLPPAIISDNMFQSTLSQPQNNIFSSNTSPSSYIPMTSNKPINPTVTNSQSTLLSPNSGLTPQIPSITTPSIQSFQFVQPISSNPQNTFYSSKSLYPLSHSTPISDDFFQQKPKTPKNSYHTSNTIPSSNPETGVLSTLTSPKNAFQKIDSSPPTTYTISNSDSPSIQPNTYPSKNIIYTVNSPPYSAYTSPQHSTQNPNSVSDPSAASHSSAGSVTTLTSLLAPKHTFPLNTSPSTLYPGFVKVMPPTDDFQSKTSAFTDTSSINTNNGLPSAASKYYTPNVPMISLLGQTTLPLSGPSSVNIQSTTTRDASVSLQNHNSVAALPLPMYLNQPSQFIATCPATIFFPTQAITFNRFSSGPPLPTCPLPSSDMSTTSDSSTSSDVSKTDNSTDVVEKAVDPMSTTSSAISPVSIESAASAAVTSANSTDNEHLLTYTLLSASSPKEILSKADLETENVDECSVPVPPPVV